jgi:hypothetical protein
VSNTGFGQDRPYGAIDDDDDFMEEWHASGEPAARTRVDDVIEPVTFSPSEPVAFSPTEPGPDMEHVYDEGMYARATPEPESAEPPVAEFVAPAPVADPYDLESIHASAAFDTPLNDLAEAIVSAHPLTPVATPAASAEPELVVEPEPVIEPEALTESADVTEPEPAAEPEPAVEPEPVEEGQLEAVAAVGFVEPEPEAIGEAEADEPEPDPLVAPDDVSDLDLVDWEPQPSSVHSDAPPEEAAPEAALAEPEPVAIDAAEEPDHSIGLTGAAAAALAAASAWGVWSGTPPVASMPAENPMQIAEPEPEGSLPSEPEPVTSESFEPEAADFVATEAPEDSQPESEATTEQPEAYAIAEEQPEPVAAEAEPAPDSYQPSGLFVPEPEVLTIPEPEPSQAPEAPAFPADIVTTPIPEPDMYAAPGLPPFPTPEPEPYVIPEPEPVAEASTFAAPTGDTTPIPEPGFTATEPLESTDTALAAEAVDSEYAAHEQVHASASENPAYDLSVDVSSIVGVAMRFVPAESAGVAPQAEDLQRQIVVNDNAAETMSARSAAATDPEPEPWSPPAEPQPEPEPEPWSPTPEPQPEPEPWSPPTEPEPEPEPEPWSPPEVAPSDSAVSEQEPPADPWAFTPPPIPESIFAPPVTEEPVPAWTPPVSAPEPSPSVPEETPSVSGDTPSWTMPASAWGEPAPDGQPASEGQTEQPHPEHEGEHSKWFDRAKMWAANNLYDPDEDESVIKPDDGHGHDEQNR